MKVHLPSQQLPKMSQLGKGSEARNACYPTESGMFGLNSDGGDGRAKLPCLFLVRTGSCGIGKTGQPKAIHSMNELFALAQFSLLCQGLDN